MQNPVAILEQAAPSADHPDPIRPPAEAKGNRFAVLLGLFLLYTIVTLAHGMRKFWYDELFTFYMSQRDGFGGVWVALKGGADFNPPLIYMVTKGFQFLFGNRELATRMPAVVGYFVMSMCLYRFISRRSTPAFGYVAAVVPWCSGVYNLASEARAYGLVLGFAGVALVCWQAATEPTRKVWPLLGFSFGLSGALLSHCFAGLIFLPFGIAELVRQYRARRFDRAMSVALLAPLGCVAIYFPLLANLKSFADNNYLFKVPWTTIPLVYSFVLLPLLWPVAISVILVAIPAYAPPHSLERGKEESSPVLWHEWAVAVGFAIVPAAAVLLAKCVSSPFFPRYGALGVIGVGLLFPLFLRWRETPARAVSLVTPVFLACFMAAFGAYVYAALVPAPTAEADSLAGRERRKDPLTRMPDLPFVVAGTLDFLELDHYATPELASRLYYLTDRDAAFEYAQTELFDRGFPILKGWFPIRGKLAPYQTFVREHPRFLVYGPYAFPTDWVIKKLIDDGANVKLLSDTDGAYGDNLLFEVTPKQWLPAEMQL